MELYNLLEEPWIDVLSEKSTTESYGIEELLINAHNQVEIVDSSPLMKYGVYRFIIAFISDVMNISNINDIEELFQKGNFSPDIIESYCEEHAGKFFLFSDTDPFYQNIKLKRYTKTNSISTLIPHLPQGRNPIWFHDAFENEHAISPAICARAIVTYFEYYLN